MKSLTWTMTALILSHLGFSQTTTKNIKQGYLIALGVAPTTRQIKEIQESKRLDTGSLREVVNYLGTYIFNNRQTVQKDIIRRSFFSVFKEYPNTKKLDDLYASTERKSKNFTDFMNEFKTFFKDNLHEPE